MNSTRSLLLLANIAGGLIGTTNIHAADLAPGLRRPVAMALTSDEQTAYVACRSGCLSTVDLKARIVVAEQIVGRQLSDVVRMPNTQDPRLLVTDEVSHELLIASVPKSGTIQVVSRVTVPHSPVSVVVSDNGTWASVACLWARQVAFVNISKRAVAKTVDLPFAPRLQLLLPDNNTLLIIDSHGGKLAFVDVKTRAVSCVRELEAHNIRGLATDGKLLHLSHQILNADKETSPGGVHWGGVMVNVSRTVPLDVLREDPDNNFVASLSFLGLPDYAAGDPAGVVMTSADKMLVAYAGMNEVGVGTKPFTNLGRIKVGRRPTAIKLGKDEATAFVVNTFGDSLSVIDVNAEKETARIELGPTRKLTSTERGELLFHNSRLASDGWYSCHSCHTDGHTNGQLNDNLSDKTYGAPKRVLSLLGTSKTGPWAWNGSVDRIEQQIQNSVEMTMQGHSLEDEQLTDLAAYLETLKPPPSIDRVRGKQDIAAIKAGRKLFTKTGCAECHTPPTYTSAETYDVGIHDQHGLRQFNPPSLIGVGQRAPYFHDNRAESLESVLHEYRHGQAGLKLNRTQRNQVAAFLRSLE